MATAYSPRTKKDRSFFVQSFIPPKILSNDSEAIDLPDTPLQKAASNANTDSNPGSIAISQLLNVASTTTYNAIQDTLSNFDTGIISSDFPHSHAAFSTLVENFKLKDLARTDLSAMEKSIQK